MADTFDYFREDTIAALSTPAGRGAIAVIRISGPDTFRLIEELCPTLRRKPREASLTPLQADTEMIDEVLVTCFPGPRSYTGEDVAEVSCHGGRAIVQAILGELTRRGARLAGPGEFTFRAVRNGKLDLIRAQAVCDLIDAASERLRRAAFTSFRGELSDRLSRLEEALVDVAVRVEAGIEFPDDVVEQETAVPLDELRGVLESIRRIRKSAFRSRLLNEGLRLVLLGRPNVGKSSLFNRLVGRERAIVSPHPGTTRDTIEAVVDIAGVPVVLVDTAGLQDQPGEIEALGIERTHEATSDSDGLLLVAEATQPLDEAEKQVVESSKRSVLTVLNKSDLVPQARFSNAEDAIRVSALTGQGVDELHQALENWVEGLLPQRQDEPQAILSVFQEEQFRAMEQSLEQATRGFERDEPEIAAEEIRNALACIGRLRGTDLTPDIMGRIFSRFCVGK